MKVSFETEYQLQEWRKVEKELFDSSGNLATRYYRLSKASAEQMLKLINQLVSEIESQQSVQNSRTVGTQTAEEKSIRMITKDDLKKYRIHSDFVGIKANLYVFTVNQINEFVEEYKRQGESKT